MPHIEIPIFSDNESMLFAIKRVGLLQNYRDQQKQYSTALMNIRISRKKHSGFPHDFKDNQLVELIQDMFYKSQLALQQQYFEMSQGMRDQNVDLNINCDSLFNDLESVQISTTNGSQSQNPIKEHPKNQTKDPNDSTKLKMIVSTDQINDAMQSIDFDKLVDDISNNRIFLDKTNQSQQIDQTKQYNQSLAVSPFSNSGKRSLSPQCWLNSNNSNIGMFEFSPNKRQCTKQVNKSNSFDSSMNLDFLFNENGDLFQSNSINSVCNDPNDLFSQIVPDVSTNKQHPIASESDSQFKQNNQSIIQNAVAQANIELKKTGNEIDMKLISTSSQPQMSVATQNLITSPTNEARPCISVDDPENQQHSQSLESQPHTISVTQPESQNMNASQVNQQPCDDLKTNSNITHSICLNSNSHVKNVFEIALEDADNKLDRQLPQDQVKTFPPKNKQHQQLQLVDNQHNTQLANSPQKIPPKSQPDNQLKMQSDNRHKIQSGNQLSLQIENQHIMQLNDQQEENIENAKSFDQGSIQSDDQLKLQMENQHTIQSNNQLELQMENQHIMQSEDQQKENIEIVESFHQGSIQTRPIRQAVEKSIQSKCYLKPPAKNDSKSHLNLTAETAKKLKHHFHSIHRKNLKFDDHQQNLASCQFGVNQADIKKLYELFKKALRS